MRDSGSIVVGWLAKLAIGLGLFGLLVFDGISLATTNLNAADHASTAASEGVEAYRSTHDVQKAYDAAVAAVAADGDTIDAPTFKVAPDGSVSLVLHRRAKTIWMQKIGPLKKWTEVTQSGEAHPVS